MPNSFKHVPFQNTRTQDVFRSIVKRRKSWKTARGGEIVWPPELEAALLEGLEAYKPDDSRETRLLGRFPMRNRFISDWIFHKTGKRRTAKQVGSRLQQLRDSCGGKNLMKLLSPCSPVRRSRYNDLSHRSYNGSDTDSSSEASSAPSTPVNATTKIHRLDDTQSSGAVISIDILPNYQSSAYVPCTTLPAEDLEWDRANGIVRLSPQARSVRSIDPTITFIGPSEISAHSSFVVYSTGIMVYSENTPLTIAGPAPERVDGSLLYSTKLVPGFWNTIADSPDPAQYTIVQDVIHDGEEPKSIFSATYKFKYPPGTSPDIFASPLMEPFHDEKLLSEVHSSLPMDCLLPMGTYPDYVDSENYYDLSALNDAKCSWEARSPSQFSAERCSTSDEELDAMLSPVSACYSADLGHY
ncbi:putative TEA/ATTS domain family protein [Lyophyllum shimeji]|uniref:TEA/ATTS domain family protein n=1 Tax=Lyophyllum shimeji TaxID=47721 RepID=A0A9P3PM87_LYOSH|nr:putative TEA/ATTS domain family protein [Lyophyllum shimeji]